MKERMKQEIKSKLGDVCIAGDAFAKEMHRLFNVIAAVLMEDETLFTNHCGQDAHRQANDDDAKKLEQLVGARVRLFHAPGHKCSECPYRIKSDGSTCNYFKVETASGYYLCLAWSQQDERPVISFDEGEHKVFTHHGNCDVSRRINEKNLSTYQEALDDAVHDVKAHGATHFSCPLAVLVAQREIEIEANPMQEIKRKADDFMAYIDSVVKG